MSTPNPDGLQTIIDQGKMKVGNPVLASTGLATLASVPTYVDSGGALATGSIPFAFPLAAGATDTSFSVVAITGSATGSANELMHLTLVGGANATATIAGYYRVTVTDSAGVVTTGAYYAPFYTLS